VRRGAHRLIELRRDFQWNSIQLESYRTEDWSGGSLQGDAQSAPSPSVRIEEPAPKAAPVEAGLTVTRRGLADHLLARAQDSLDSGDVAAATDAVEHALALDPSNSIALVAAAVLHHRGGNMVKARSCLDRALALSSDDVLALTVRGIVELGQGAPHSARRYLQRVHSLSPSALTAVALSGALLALGDHQAVCALLEPMANDNAPAELYANLAFAQWSHGAADDARASLQQAMVAGADPRNPRVVALQRKLAVRPDELTH